MTDCTRKRTQVREEGIDATTPRISYSLDLEDALAAVVSHSSLVRKKAAFSALDGGTKEALRVDFPGSVLSPPPLFLSSRCCASILPCCTIAPSVKTSKSTSSSEGTSSKTHRKQVRTRDGEWRPRVLLGVVACTRRGGRLMCARCVFASS